MKIDPVTGKAYLKDWQRDLDRIHHAGFSYGYVEIVDLATGDHAWQVDAMKGDGPRVVVEMPTISGAVKELKRLLQPMIYHPAHRHLGDQPGTI
jgi:hypothetical protein